MAPKLVSHDKPHLPVKVPHLHTEKHPFWTRKVILTGCPLPPVFLCVLSDFLIAFFFWYVLPPFCVTVMMPVFEYIENYAKAGRNRKTERCGNGEELFPFVEVNTNRNQNLAWL